MNEPERLELERLKEQQARLHLEVAQFSKQLELLEQRLRQPELPGRATEPPTAAHAPGVIRIMPKIEPPDIQNVAPPLGIPLPPPPIPPIIAPAPASAQTSAPTPSAPNLTFSSPGQRPKLHLRAEEKAFLKGTCRACGGHLEFPATSVGDTIPCPHCGEPTLLAAGAGPIPVPPRVPQPAPAGASQGGGTRPPQQTAPGRQGSFEMRLGTYWLVRIGIVMLLTGLVFFGNYAYQNYIGKLSAGGKVTLLYLASGILLGAGTWWQRRPARESLKNYAQVLFAGGLATVYFTTYAAHHFEHLRIIETAGVDGGLLLAWAGFMVWIADRKKSEVLALFAVLLAYYTGIITHVGLFTLYSNLVLTVAAVFFLVRNRWAALTFASLAATYAAYGFWRFLHGSEWRWAFPEEGLWTGTYFLISYWVLFTTAVFLSKDEKFAREQRAGFLTLNNGAFFTLFLLTMYQVHQGGFWKFSLIYGATLLGLAELARRVLGPEPLAKNAYLTQGLLLVTVGFITKFSGLQLALILAAESVMLLMLDQQRKSRILRISAYLSAGLAVGWGMDGMRQNEPHGLWLGMGLGALMLWNALLVDRQTRSANAALRPQPAYFAALALAIWLAATYDNTSHEHFPLVLALEGMLLTFSIYLLGVREITLFGQGYIVLAQLAWVFNYALQNGASPPWWNPMLLIAITLGLSHWWQKQKVLNVPSQIGGLCQGLYALAIIGVLYFWLDPKVQAPVWLVTTSLLAIGITAYGVLTRAWLLAAFGQIFMLVSGAQFVWQLSQGEPAWYFALAPMAALALLSFWTVNWFDRRPGQGDQVREPLLQLAQVYRWVALGMSIWWVCHYIPARERIWLLSLLGSWFFLWAGLRRKREALLISAAYTIAGLILFWLPLIGTPKVYLPNLLVILLLLGQRQMARRLPDRYPLSSEIHGAVIVVGGLSLWLFLSLWVLRAAAALSNPGGYLTASWSVFALMLFSVGIVLRERMYRWLGLGVLACALGRVVILDVWKLETPYRILSFMALGVVLLVLGFIYNKYQEKINEWL